MEEIIEDFLREMQSLSNWSLLVVALIWMSLFFITSNLEGKKYQERLCNLTAIIGVGFEVFWTHGLAMSSDAITKGYSDFLYLCLAGFGFCWYLMLGNLRDQTPIKLFPQALVISSLAGVLAHATANMLY